MTLYPVSNKQLILNSFLMAIILAIVTISYIEYKDRRELPEMQTTSDGKCVKVINYKNGDAYNCNDVNVVLRHYKTSVVTAQAVVPSTN
jgi:hypothetical protein